MAMYKKKVKTLTKSKTNYDSHDILDLSKVSKENTFSISKKASLC